MLLAISADLFGMQKENPSGYINESEYCLCLSKEGCEGQYGFVPYQNGSNGFDIFAEILVWSAQESGADNWGQVFEIGANGGNIDIIDVPFGWDCGYRVGMDYRLCYDSWDTQVYYTGYSTKGKNEASTTGEIASPFLGNYYIRDQLNQNVGYRDARIEWAIEFTMFDWELGRNFWIYRDLSFRPFIGLKGGWIHQAIDSLWQNPVGTLPLPFVTATENLKNNFWGIGPSLGLNTKWKLDFLGCPCLNLFGDFSGAMLWGKWTFSDFYENDSPQEVTVDVPSVNGAAPAFRTFVGIGWDVPFHPEPFRFSLRLGYEAQFWLNQLQFYSYNVGRLNNVLTLQGATLDLLLVF